MDESTEEVQDQEQPQEVEQVEQLEEQEELDPKALLEQQRKKNSENRKLRERAKAAESELEEFRAWKESQKTEAEKQAEREAEMLERAQAAERRLWSREIADEYSLPKSALKFLHGDTEEELRESASELQELLSIQEEPVPRRGWAGQSASSKSGLSTDEQQARQIFRGVLGGR